MHSSVFVERCFWYCGIIWNLLSFTAALAKSHHPSLTGMPSKPWMRGDFSYVQDITACICIKMHSTAACKSMLRTEFQSENTMLSHKKLPTVFTKAPCCLLLAQMSGHSGCNFFASAKSWFQFVAMNSCFLTCVPNCCWLCLLPDVLQAVGYIVVTQFVGATCCMPFYNLHPSSSFYQLFPFQWCPAFVLVFVRFGTLSTVGRTVLRRKNSQGSEQSSGTSAHEVLVTCSMPWGQKVPGKVHQIKGLQANNRNK